MQYVAVYCSVLQTHQRLSMHPEGEQDDAKVIFHKDFELQEASTK